MANRFPLILNTSSNQIQEIASGDTLDLTGTGLNLTGITTLSSSAQLNLQGGTNINTGTRGDILYYNASGTIQKLSLGTSGKVLRSNGSDLVYGDSASTANVYYVSTSGQDASGRGGSVDTAYRTIKYACTNITTPTATAPAIIFVKSGVYEEASLPIVVPAFTTIAGDSLRATIIKPASGLDSGGSVQNNRSTMFRMSNATVLQDLVMDGMGGYTPGSPNYKPESATVGGTYIALNAASAITTKSPYIYNVTSFGNGATGAVLDGSLHSSGNRSMLFHTYTAVHSDGLGIFLKNNANAEMISTFTYYCTVGFAAIGGSKIRSLNSSNSYGEYGVYAAGFDAGETANSGTIKGQMLVYTNVLTTSFTDGEVVTGATSGATARVVNVQAEPKRIYIVQRSGTFQSSETVTGGSSGATATLTSGTATVNQSGRILVTTFTTAPDAGDSLQFASTDGNAYQIQTVSSVTANSVAYKVLVFSTSRATAVAENVAVHARKEFSLARLTSHDFLQVGTGGTDTTNWPNNPTQDPSQADQVVTNETDPGRVYYTATDDLGNFYVGDQFKVDQATGNVTLDASAFNLSGLESLRLGSVGGLIGAAVGEFSTDVTLSQNSDTKVSTQKAVKTYVDTLDGITPVGGTFTVAGISTVTGTTQFTKQLNVSGVSTFHNNVDLLDGDRLRLGSSQDMQLYHDGNHSYVVENGTGNLRIKALTGGVELYHNDVLRLTTSTTGVSIGGSLSVSGVLTYEDVTNVDSVGVVTARNGLKVTGGTSFFAGAIAAAGAITGTASTATNVTVADESSDTTCFPTFVTAATGNLPPKTGSNLTFNSSDGTLTATTFSGSGASLTNLNGSNIASGTVPVARIGTGTKNNTTFYRGDGTFQVVNTDLSADTSPQLGGDLGLNGNIINVADGGRDANQEHIRWGADGDLRIYHTGGGNSTIEHNSSGTDLIIKTGSSADDIHIQPQDDFLLQVAGGTKNSIIARNDGTTELYWQGSSNAGKKFETTETGATISCSSGAVIQFGGTSGSIYRSDGNGAGIHFSGDQILPSNGSGAVANNAVDLGAPSYRWRNIYSADLQLSNKGSSNNVDGTWGDFTIQEGESDLFLINNRSGKKYKFNLTEVN